MHHQTGNIQPAADNAKSPRRHFPRIHPLLVDYHSVGGATGGGAVAGDDDVDDKEIRLKMLTAGMLDFLSPVFLWALVPALALPVIAHLLARRRTGPSIMLPTTRFLREAQIERGSRMGLSEMLLLIARITIASLIVIAFAQPVWLTPSVFDSGPHGNKKNGKDVVIIIDASASMQRAAPLVTCFDQAKARAIDLLVDSSQQFNPATDRAAVILAALHPQPLLPDMTSNFSALVARLKESGTHCTLEAANLDAAVAKAIDMLSNDDGRTNDSPQKHILIITDGQRSTLDTLSSATVQSLGDALLDIESLNGKTEPDQMPSHFEAALTDLTTSTAGRAVLPGRTVHITCNLLNPTPKEEQALLTLMPTFSDGRAPLTPISMPVKLNPNGTSSVIANVPIPPDAGSGAVIINAHVTHAEGRDDDFPFDNQMTSIITIQSSARVGIVGASHAIAATGDHALSYFISLALDPEQGAETHSASQFRVTNLATGDAKAFADQLSTCDAVVIADHASDLTLDDLRALHDAIADRGIGLFWIIDSSASAQKADEFASIEPDHPTIPFRFTGEDQQGKSRTLKTIDTNLLQSPLAVFNGNGPALAALNAITFNPQMQVRLNQSAQSFIQDSAGQPVLARIALGRGQVLMFNGDLSPASGSLLVKQPVFVPFINELTASLLTPVDSGLVARTPVANVGEPMQFSWFDSSAGNRDAMPVDAVMNGAPTRHVAAHRATGEGSHRWLVSTDPWLAPGLVRIADPQQPQTPLAWGTVHIDPSESDLALMPSEAIAAKLTQLRSASKTPPLAASRSSLSTSSPTPTSNTRNLWPIAIALALFMFVFESLTIWWTRRRESRLTKNVPHLIATA